MVDIEGYRIRPQLQVHIKINMELSNLVPNSEARSMDKDV